MAGPSTTTARLSVAFVDLDRFKPINDLLGHAAGDELLRNLAARLRGAVREATSWPASAATSSSSCTEASGEERRRSRRTPGGSGGPTVPASTGPAQIFASVGVATARPSHTAEALLSEADAEMYAVKRKPTGQPPGPTMARGERRVLAEQLAVALTDDQLVVHYQPIVDLAGSTVVGLEALVRWQHPERGLLQPAAFLGVAEDAGLESEVDNVVLRPACAQLAALDATCDLARLSMSVNSVDRSTGRATASCDLVRSMLNEHGLAPERLCFEITERRILERPDHGPATPVGVTLDAARPSRACDWPSTTSVPATRRLTHVLQLPDPDPQDRPVVRQGITTDRQRHSIVAAITELARGMGIDAIAKGIEHSDQLEALRRSAAPSVRATSWAGPDRRNIDRCPRARAAACC